MKMRSMWCRTVRVDLLAVHFRAIAGLEVGQHEALRMKFDRDVFLARLAVGERQVAGARAADEDTRGAERELVAGLGAERDEEPRRGGRRRSGGRRPLARRQLHGPDRKGDDDPAAGEFLPDASPHLAVDARLLRDVLDPEAQLVVDRALGEGEHEHVGSRLLQHPGDSHGSGEKCLAHPVGRRLVFASDDDALHVHRVRVVVVEDLLIRHLGVGDDQVVAVARAQVGGAPRDRDHSALHVAELDPVVDPVGLLEADDDAGEDVAEDRLQRETDDQRGDRRPGHQAGEREGGKAELEGDDGGNEVGRADRHHRQEIRQPDTAVRQMEVEVEQAGEPDDGDRAQEEQDPRQGVVERLVSSGREQREDPQPRRNCRHEEDERKLANDEKTAQTRDDGDQDRRNGEAREDG